MIYIYSIYFCCTGALFQLDATVVISYRALDTAYYVRAVCDKVAMRARAGSTAKMNERCVTPTMTDVCVGSINTRCLFIWLVVDMGRIGFAELAWNCSSSCFMYWAPVFFSDQLYLCRCQLAPGGLNCASNGNEVGFPVLRNLTECVGNGHATA